MRGFTFKLSFQISEMLFLGHSMTSTQAMSCGLITREISSKNDKDFEDKVSQIVRECVDGRYTEVSFNGLDNIFPIQYLKHY